ncbi:hypothetical protein [Paraprevotella clara]|jgi:hypothetical protein|uniref:hypothetical protein n=1 Tax=Paraprevotella clara TaxID=454154 RepID=UPI00266CE834|nr:hypothetical protein [Paraprevotella clara]
MAGRMLRGLTALACGISCEGQASLSKSQIGLHENPLFASPCGRLRKYAILAGQREDSLSSVWSFPATSGRPGCEVLRRRVTGVIVQIG